MRKLKPNRVLTLKIWEGLRLEAYQDEAGVWTVGYGHTGPEVVKGLVITKAKAEALLLEDISEAIEAVDALVVPELTDDQYFVLVSFVFNVGMGAFRKSTLLRKLNAGDFDAVPGELAKWNKITDPRTKKKKVSPGLVNRRAAEIAVWTEVTGAPSVVAAEPSNKPMYKKPEAQGTALMASSAVGEQLTSTATQLSMFAEYSDYIRAAFMVLMLAGVGLTIYGIVKNKED